MCSKKMTISLLVLLSILGSISCAPFYFGNYYDSYYNDYYYDDYYYNDYYHHYDSYDSPDSLDSYYGYNPYHYGPYYRKTRDASFYHDFSSENSLFDEHENIIDSSSDSHSEYYSYEYDSRPFYEHKQTKVQENAV